MPTFILKKYDDKKEEVKENETPENEKKEEEELTITVSGPIAEIVAKALYKTFENKLEVREEEEENNDTSVKAISTENINKDPLTTFNLVKNGDIVFIDTGRKPFSTKEEEWFLTNINNKTDKVFFSVESLIKYIEERLCLQR